MYLVLFKPQQGEKFTAYSFVEKEVLNTIPKDIIKLKKLLPLTEVPNKVEARILVEKYDKG